jgi:hypothetical protein
VGSPRRISSWIPAAGRSFAKSSRRGRIGPGHTDWRETPSTKRHAAPRLPTRLTRADAQYRGRAALGTPALDVLGKVPPPLKSASLSMLKACLLQGLDNKGSRIGGPIRQLLARDDATAASFGLHTGT